MKKFYFVILFLSTSIAVFAQSLTSYVNPMIGTGGHAHTFPGATLPFGAVQLSPDTGVEGWDWCSGYHYSDSSIIGFSHTHLSGTGAADYGDILLMPTVGKINFNPGTKESPDEGYRSRFSHDREITSPGYYSVELEDYNIQVELTATTRTGIHRYTFPKSDSANILIDLAHGISDETKEAQIKIVSDTRIEGYRISEGWAPDQHIYFVMEFSKPFEKYGVAVDDMAASGKEATGKNVKGYISYKTNDNEQIIVKVAVSGGSIDGASANLAKEADGWDFDSYKKEAEQAWEKELNKIVVEGGTDAQKTVFYTALYHSLIHPDIFMDVDGQYRGMDNEIHKADDFGYYTTFSLWDTYRALHPLLTIIDPETDNDLVKTLVKKYEENGILPLWELASNETNTMIGYHAVPIIVDAYMKGIRNYDIDKAYEAIKHSADMDHLGLESYKRLGYVASEVEHEAVSKTLEYAYDDWCIAMMAKELGHEDDYERFSKRAESYRNIFDGQSGFMRGKREDGTWAPFFNPYEVTRDFTEANAWQYSLYVPQDVKGLIDLHGSKEELDSMIDAVFGADSKLEGKTLSDISGLIGQYAHGNEPSHHIAYLYNYIGEPWKTQKWARYIMDNLYTDKIDGLSGNEDCGQMSAWYILSAMGFYPVCPGSNQYIIGSPVFNKVTLNLDNGKTFVIKADNVSTENIYIQSAKLDGKDYSKNYFHHSDITNGSELVFEMGNTPNKDWGTSQLPYSFSTKDFVSPPYQKEDIAYFEGTAKVDLDSRTEGASIYYTTDRSAPDQNSTLYTEPFEIANSVLIKAIAIKDGYLPSTVTLIDANKLIYQAAVDPGEVVNGVSYKYYEGEFASVSELAGSKVIKSGTQEYFSLDSAQVEDHFGFDFEGYIKIPVKGIYRFYTESDDGSILDIDGKRVVSNDGSHAALEASGIMALEAGFHKIKVLYMEDYEGNSLRVMWQTQNGELKKQDLPAEVLYIN